MQLRYTLRFREKLREAPPQVQQAFIKQANYLLANLRYPSLHAKRYDRNTNMWQARVNRSWRFYFTIDDNIYTLHTIIPHPK